jgi:DNA-binding response OmpR family regulator
MNGVGRPAILVVDDSSAVCAAVSMLLEDDGFLVETSESYSEALRITEDQPFDLILIDAQLGLDSGLKLAEELLARLPDSKIVIMSGADLNLHHHSADVARLPVLPKPFNREELLNCIRKVTERAA